VDATDREPPPGPHVDPRFTLASERTFLAWSRTALGLVAAGLAVTQLVEVDGALGRRLIGAPLIGAGATVAALAHRRRVLVERALANGDPLPRTSLPALLTAILIIAALGARWLWPSPARHDARTQAFPSLTKAHVPAPSLAATQSIRCSGSSRGRGGGCRGASWPRRRTGATGTAADPAPQQGGAGALRTGPDGRPAKRTLEHLLAGKLPHEQWARGDLNPHVLSDTGT
jgi:putative membrane protein